MNMWLWMWRGYRSALEIDIAVKEMSSRTGYETRATSLVDTDCAGKRLQRV
jgi:hypothetical protein